MRHHTEFQFHKGAIKRQAVHARAAQRDGRFNSIKVRLKDVTGDVAFYLPDLFQFHKGAIKSSQRHA